MNARLISILKNNWGILLVLGIIVFWGGFLRLYHLEAQSLWIDEGYTINAAQGVTEHGYPILDSGASYDPHILHTYITAGSIKLFGFDANNPWPARLPAAIFGILAIIAIFFFTKRVTGNTMVALCASFLMAFSYWEISWSRQARGYADMQFFILLSFTFFYNWLEQNKLRDAVLSILFLVLSYLSHGIALIFIPSFFILFLMHSLQSGKLKKSISPTIIGFFLLLGGFAAWILVKILPPIAISPYSERYLSFFTNELKYVSLFAFSIISGLFLGKNKFERVMYVICIILPTVIIIMFYTNVIQMRYILTVFPFLLAAGSYGLYVLIFRKEYMKPVFMAILYLLAIAGIAFTMTTFIPKTTYILEVGSPQPNFKNGYGAISTLRKSGDIIISPYTHLSKIYLGERGLWLPISLTNWPNEIAEHTINGSDYYTGAPIIPNKESLMNILDTDHGYIIIDSMARERLGNLFTAIIQHPRVVLIYYEKNNADSAVAVYRFGI